MARIKIEITPAQLEAIKSAGDWFSAIQGGMDDEPEKEVAKIIRHIDKMLKDNNLEPRDYN